MTASMVLHVTDLTPPGSECNPGLRVWRECVQIHRRCAERDAVIIKEAGLSGANQALDELAERAVGLYKLKPLDTELGNAW
jgi:hypothetical protein